MIIPTPGITGREPAPTTLVVDASLGGPGERLLDDRLHPSSLPLVSEAVHRAASDVADRSQATLQASGRPDDALLALQILGRANSPRIREVVFRAASRSGRRLLNGGASLMVLVLAGERFVDGVLVRQPPREEEEAA